MSGQVRPNTGKKQRLKLQVKRATDRSTGIRLNGQNVSIEEEAAHDFRLPGIPKDLLTVFHVREAAYEVEKRLIAARDPLPRCVKQSENPANKPAIQSSPLYQELIDIPQRPAWKRGMKASKLHTVEYETFEKYLSDVYARFPPHRLNHFEHNVLVWAQLWRVCEQSDLLVLSADARHPMFHFPPSLYHYVTRTLNKPVVLVLNKIDLINQSTLDEWFDWFAQEFPALTVIPFTSFPNEQSIVSTIDDITVKRKDRTKLRCQPWGVKELMQLFEKYAQEKKSKVDTEYQQLLVQSGFQESDPVDETEADEEEEAPAAGLNDLGIDDIVNLRPTGKGRPKPPSSALIVGTIGHPNAGKSSLINALFGSSVVSVSATPGHTKHLQSLALTPSITVMDCPGLVFPAVDMPRPLQVLCGIFPITQLREPYSSIAYLAERVPLETIYNLRPAENTHQTNNDDDPDDMVSQLQSMNAPVAPWSAWSMCEALARQRNYTRKGGAGQPDTRRAADEMLNDCLKGKVVLMFRPPEKGTKQAVKDNEAHNQSNINEQTAPSPSTSSAPEAAPQTSTPSIINQNQPKKPVSKPAPAQPPQPLTSLDQTATFDPFKGGPVKVIRRQK